MHIEWKLKIKREATPSTKHICYPCKIHRYFIVHTLWLLFVIECLTKIKYYDQWILMNRVKSLFFFVSNSCAYFNRSFELRICWLLLLFFSFAFLAHKKKCWSLRWSSSSSSSCRFIVSYVRRDSNIKIKMKRKWNWMALLCNTSYSFMMNAYHFMHSPNCFSLHAPCPTFAVSKFSIHLNPRRKTQPEFWFSEKKKKRNKLRCK